VAMLGSQSTYGYFETQNIKSKNLRVSDLRIFFLIVVGFPHVKQILILGG
jgi:hypothetical protein